MVNVRPDAVALLTVSPELLVLIGKREVERVDRGKSFLNWSWKAVILPAASQQVCPTNPSVLITMKTYLRYPRAF